MEEINKCIYFYKNSVLYSSACSTKIKFVLCKIMYNRIIVSERVHFVHELIIRASHLKIKSLITNLAGVNFVTLYLNVFLEFFTGNVNFSEV